MIQNTNKIYIEVIYNIFVDFNNYYKAVTEKDLAIFKIPTPFGKIFNLSNSRWYEDSDSIGRFYQELYEKVQEDRERSGRTAKKIPQYIARKYNDCIKNNKDFFVPTLDGPHRTNPNELCIALGYDSYKDYIEKKLKEKSVEPELRAILLKQLDEFSALKKQDIEYKEEIKYPLENEIPIYHWWCYLSDITRSEEQKSRGIICGKLGMYKDKRVLLIIKHSKNRLDKYEGTFEQSSDSILKISLKHKSTTNAIDEKPEFMFHTGRNNFEGNSPLHIEYLSGAYLGYDADGHVVSGLAVLQSPKNINSYADKKLSDMSFTKAHEELIYTTKFKLSDRRDRIKSPQISNGNYSSERKYRKLKEYQGTYFSYNIMEDDKKTLHLRQSIIRINDDLIVDCYINKSGVIKNEWQGRVSSLNSENGLVALTIFTKRSPDNDRAYYWKIMLDFSKNKDAIKGAYIFSSDSSQAKFNIGNILLIRTSPEDFSRENTALIPLFSEKYFEIDKEKKLNLFRTFSDYAEGYIHMLPSLIKNQGAPIKDYTQKSLKGTYISYFYYPFLEKIVASVVKIYDNGFVESYSKSVKGKRIASYHGEIRHIQNQHDIFTLFIVDRHRSQPVYMVLRFSNEGHYFHGLYVTMQNNPTRPRAGRNILVRYSKDLISIDEINEILLNIDNLHQSEDYKPQYDKVCGFLEDEQDSILEGFGNKEFSQNKFKTKRKKISDSVDKFNAACYLAMNDESKANYEQVCNKLYEAYEMGFKNKERAYIELQKEHSLGRYETMKEFIPNLFGVQL